MNHSTPTKLLYPKIAAWLLAAYAVVYTVLMLVFLGAGVSRDPSVAVYILAMLALAITPFLALVHLPRVQDGTIGLMAVGMALIMACPTVFWGALFIAEATSPVNHDIRDMSVAIGLLGMPAALSTILCFTFARAAWRQFRA